MLQRARLLHEEGVDIVIGLVETHSRAETEALTRGLEILPRRKVRWQGREIEEFDLDGALSRRPKLIIVDELAHSNAPESRHPKRWQDVEELLDARIDVWTALNIQHLESLADVVSRITGVIVRETVPDIVLRDADDIVLVDITSEDLIQRLKDGKVYLAETARLAQQKFFTLRNLTALREIALRRTAARVDDQMVEQLRQGAIGGPWETSERLLVCVGPDALSMDVVRAASRLATGLNASWVAATVDRPSGDAGGGGGVDAAFRLAQSLGAETTRLVGHDMPAEILGYAERENITQIVVGRSKAGFLGRLAGRSLSDALAHRASLVGVHIFTGDKPREAPRRRRLAALFDRDLPIGALAAAGSVAAAVGVGEALNRWLRLPNLSMLFLIAVLVSAARFGVRAAIAAAMLSFLAFDFFFVPPYYQFTIAEPQEFFALVIFLAAASLVGWLAGRARDQERLARASAQATRSLFEFSRKLSGARDARRHPRHDDRLRPEDAGGAQRRHAAARGRRARVERRLAADRRARSRRERRRALGLRQERAGGLEDRHSAQRALPVPSAGHLARRARRLRPGAVRPRGADLADARARAQPHSRAGGDRHRPRAAGQGLGAHGRAGGEREAARHFARLAVARPAHAAGDDHRRGDDAAQVRRRHGARAARRPARLDRGGERAADPLHRQPARHVADRSRRAEAQAATWSTSSKSSARRSSVRARSSPASPS